MTQSRVSRNSRGETARKTADEQNTSWWALSRGIGHQWELTRVGTAGVRGEDGLWRRELYSGQKEQCKSKTSKVEFLENSMRHFPE